MTFVLVSVVYAVAVGEPSFGNVGPFAVGLSLFAMVFAGELKHMRGSVQSSHRHLTVGKHLSIHILLCQCCLIAVNNSMQELLTNML